MPIPFQLEVEAPHRPITHTIPAPVSRPHARLPRPPPPAPTPPPPPTDRVRRSFGRRSRRHLGAHVGDGCRVEGRLLRHHLNLWWGGVASVDMLHMWHITRVLHPSVRAETPLICLRHA